MASAYVETSRVYIIVYSPQNEDRKSSTWKKLRRPGTVRLESLLCVNNNFRVIRTLGVAGKCASAQRQRGDARLPFCQESVLS